MVDEIKVEMTEQLLEISTALADAKCMSDFRTITRDNHLDFTVVKKGITRSNVEFKAVIFSVAINNECVK